MRISDWSSDVCSSDLASIERARSGEALTIGNPRSDPRESWRTRRGWPALGCTRSTVGRAVSETAQLDCPPVPCLRPRGSSVTLVSRNESGDNPHSRGPASTGRGAKQRKTGVYGQEEPGRGDKWDRR